MKNILWMTIKREPFEAIKNGSKIVEYRNLSKHWYTKLYKQRDNIKMIILQNGRTENCPKLAIIPTAIKINRSSEYLKIHFRVF